MIKKWLERLFGIDKLRKELEEDRKKYQYVFNENKKCNNQPWKRRGKNTKK
jgi:hypothetical protein